MTNQELNQSRKTKTSFFYGYIIIVAAFFTQVPMIGSHTSFGVFFKPMIADFGWTRALTSGAHSISMMMQGLSGIVMGGLNDRLGPRIVMTLCGFLVGLGLLLMSQISAAWQMYFFFSFILGAGMGGVIAPPMSTVARWFVRRRSMMTGIVIAGGGTGIFAIPLLANWLISAYGWRNAYIILGVIVLVIVILVAQFLKRDPTKMGQVPYGADMRQEQELNIGVEGLSLKDTVLTRQFWMVVVMFFSHGFGVSTILVHIVPHATDLGISAATATGILSTIGMVNVAGSILMGGLADRIGVRQTVIVCFTLLSVAMFWLLNAREVWMLYLFAIVQGLAHGGNSALHSPLVAELFGLKSHGLILGVSAFSATFGATFGPFIAGYIFDVSGSYQMVFSFSAALGIIGLILAALLRPVRKLGAVNSLTHA